MHFTFSLAPKTHGYSSPVTSSLKMQDYEPYQILASVLSFTKNSNTKALIPALIVVISKEMTLSFPAKFVEK